MRPALCHRKRGSMTEKTVPSFNVDIHMAGDIVHAGQIIQRYAAETGLCVTLTPQSFIYTGGREEGFKVGFTSWCKACSFGAQPVALTTSRRRAQYQR